MNNQERVAALNLARRKALEYAVMVDEAESGRYGDFRAIKIDKFIKMSTMWSAVAEAMKVGDSNATDGVDGNSMLKPIAMHDS